MTDAQTMKGAVERIIREELDRVAPLPAGIALKFQDVRFNSIREAIIQTEQRLRTLIAGDEAEVHEWLAVIHYALADERERLLGYTG